MPLLLMLALRLRGDPRGSREGTVRVHVGDRHPLVSHNLDSARTVADIDVKYRPACRPHRRIQSLYFALIAPHVSLATGIGDSLSTRMLSTLREVQSARPQ